MPPIAFRVEVAQVQTILQAELDAAQSTGDLAGNEGFATHRRFVVEQDAVTGIHAVGLTVIHRDPIRIEFGHPIRRARIKRRRFVLGRALNLAEHLRGRRLIVTDALFQTQNTDRFENT